LSTAPRAARFLANPTRTNAMKYQTRRSAQSQSPTADKRLCRALAIALLTVPAVALAEPADHQKPVQRNAIIVAQAKTQSDARAMVSLMNQLDGLNRELNKLRGKIEELGNSILNAEKRQKDMYLDLDTRLRRIETTNADVARQSKKASELLSVLQGRMDRMEQSAATGAPMSARDPGTSGDQTQADAAGAQATNAVVHRAYEEAMAKYRSRQYQDAIDAFQVIVNQYPGHPLAVNAQYWTGDSFYQLRAYRSAVDAQKFLVETYPDSAKAPDALLNMGSAQLGLGDAVSARRSWEKLIATYPASRAAAKAGDRLKRLP
jgi:tol-pal system protein YbgF